LSLGDWVPAPFLVGVELNPGPNDRRNLDTRRKWEIVVLAEQAKQWGVNYTWIGRKVGCSHQTVKNVLQKYQETGSIDNRPGKGRKRIFSEKEEKKIVKKAKQGKFSPEIAQEVVDTGTRKPPVRTVQRVIRRSGLRYQKVKKMEKLTVDHKQRRVDYCNERKDYNWNRVLFTDEKTFHVGASPDFAWQEQGHRIEEPKVSYPLKLNVWGGIGTHLKTKLYYFSSNMNSELYTKVLKKSLKHKNLIFSPKCPKRLKQKYVFLQDNARYHKKAKSMDTLRDLVGDRVIEHPARSPDLNPMEDMWSYLDRKVKEVRPQTIKSLKRTLTKAWKMLPWSYVARSTNSMSKRLAACVEKGGERLQY